MGAAGGLIFLLLILLVPLAATIYILYTRLRAQRAGLPPPSLSSYNPFAKRTRPSQNDPVSFGFVGWVRSKLHSSSSFRGGTYEQPLGRRGARGLDPDEAWDARVGNEADGYGTGGYYEEQELDLHPSLSGEAYAGGGYGDGHGQILPDYESDEAQRGRSINRGGESRIGGTQQGLDRRYDEEMGRGDPFRDGAERSDLRGISSRPVADNERGHRNTDSGDSTTERRSIFREDV
jgi:hypothetical protein